MVILFSEYHPYPMTIAIYSYKLQVVISLLE